jgi:hypothetical protein
MLILLSGIQEQICNFFHPNLWYSPTNPYASLFYYPNNNKQIKNTNYITPHCGFSPFPSHTTSFRFIYGILLEHFLLNYFKHKKQSFNNTCPYLFPNFTLTFSWESILLLL